MQRIVVLLTIVFLLVGCSGCGAAGGMEKEAENAAMQELNKYPAIPGRLTGVVWQ
jgi:PBP1b-binding outer membrane lipoprotein LpoB